MTDDRGPSANLVDAAVRRFPIAAAAPGAGLLG
jgi:hypothetical protein